MAKVEWTGDAELMSVADSVFRSPAAATAVVVLKPGSEITATAGGDHDSSCEIESISKALTGMLYRDAVERGMHPLRRTLRLWSTGENPYGDSLTDLLSQVRHLRVGSPRPGYSNLGFQLLGHAVAEAAGKSYEQLPQDALGAGCRAPMHQEDLGPKDPPGVNRSGRPQQAWLSEALSHAGGIRATVTTGGFSNWIGVDRNAGTAAAVFTAAQRSVDRQGFRAEL